MKSKQKQQKILKYAAICLVAVSPLILWLTMRSLAEYQKKDNYRKSIQLVETSTPEGYKLEITDDFKCRDSSEKFSAFATYCYFRFRYSNVDMSKESDTATIRSWLTDKGWQKWVSHMQHIQSEEYKMDEYYFTHKKDNVLKQTFNCDVSFYPTDRPQISGQCMWKYNGLNSLYAN